jgi:hypothetical protein
LNQQPVPQTCSCGKHLAWRNITADKHPSGSTKLEPMWCCPDYVWRNNTAGHLGLPLLDVLKRPDGMLVVLSAYER